jgi:hypothetical protein
VEAFKRTSLEALVRIEDRGVIFLKEKCTLLLEHFARTGFIHEFAYLADILTIQMR